MTRRPDTSEHSAYLGRYIATVPDGDITITLDALGRETVHLLSAIGEEAAAAAAALRSISVEIGPATVRAKFDQRVLSR